MSHRLAEKRARMLSRIGEVVRLRYPVRTRGGETYAVGTLWRIHDRTRGHYRDFNIEGVDRDGRTEITDGCIARFVRNVDEFKLERVEPQPSDDAEDSP